MPTIEEALQLGWKQHQSGNLRGAEEIYRQVLLFAPSNENAWCFLGMACHDQGRYEEAIAAYHQAIGIKPNFPVALSNRGNTLKQLGRLTEAEASCREALRYKPDYSTAYNNLGVVLVAQGRLIDSAAIFERALQLMPTDAVAHANLGAALVRQGKFDEGTAKAQRALSINPNYAEAHKNQAIVWLLLADFERGWPEYEWRWRCPGASLPRFTQPQWNGEPLDGRRLLLHWEQGLGDTIQFVRYARLFHEQGARVLVCCQKPLAKLLRFCQGIDELIIQGDPFPDFDFWIPMLSVPGVLETKLETIPAECGYLKPDPQLVEYWRNRLQSYNGFRIAIAWQGSPDFHADRQRSVPLRYFEPIARIPGVQLVSLQKGFGSEQIEQLDGLFSVIEFSKEIDTASGPFMDTAAIMANMDLIISSDTSVPHLAGALDLPVWVALSVSPDWRWLLNRDDSPWYPSMRLFRQQTLGDWADVFERIAKATAERVAGVRVSSSSESGSVSGEAADVERAGVDVESEDSDVESETGTEKVEAAERAEDSDRESDAEEAAEDTALESRATGEAKDTALESRATGDAKDTALESHVTGDAEDTALESHATGGRRILSTGFNALTHTRHGVMLFNTNDMYIGRSLELYGEFSEEEIDVFRYVVREGDVVVEGGANIGTHTVPIAKLCGARGHVWAFEPQRIVFQTLCANIALNSLTNVQCRQQALSNQPGEIAVPLLDARVETNFGGLGLGRYSQGERVPVVTIDSLELPACRLIKMDIEGMEENALRGAARTIERFHPVLYVENDRVENSPPLIRYIQSCGYELFWHTPRMFRENNFRNHRENVFNNIVSVNMLCVHPLSQVTINGLRPITNPESRWNDR